MGTPWPICLLAWKRYYNTPKKLCKGIFLKMTKCMLCIKDFHMRTGELAYKKGELYEYTTDRWGDDRWPYDFKSEVTERISHQMSKDTVNKHFIDPDKFEYLKDEDMEIDI